MGNLAHLRLVSVSATPHWVPPCPYPVHTHTHAYSQEQVPFIFLSPLCTHSGLHILYRLNSGSQEEKDEIGACLGEGTRWTLLHS